MLLTARLLQDVGGVNVFRPADRIAFTEGDPQDVYFQLVDASLDTDLKPSGRRYAPAAGAVLQVTVISIDSSKQFTRVASQPFPQDPSIWKLSILSSDKVAGTVSLGFQLTEGGAVRTGRLQPALDVRSQSTYA
jgi:hypothetical protein